MSCTPYSGGDSAEGAAHFASRNDRIPNAISPSATRMSSHGPKGDWANERSAPSASKVLTNAMA